MVGPRPRPVRIRRALTWTLVAGALVAQAFHLLRFADAATVAYIRDPSRFDGRFWHGSEWVFVLLAYLLLVPTVTSLVHGWIKALRRLPHDVAAAEAAAKATGSDQDADTTADGASGEDDPAVAIELPAFLAPKTRRVRKGVGALAAWTLLGSLVALGGIVLGLIEATQMRMVAQRFAGEPDVLTRTATLWIQRLYTGFAPALELVGLVVVAVAWGVLHPLPPAETVVVGGGPSPDAADPTGKTRWSGVE